MTELATTDTPPKHRVRIQSQGLTSNTDVLIDGVSAGQHITAIDWHLDVDRQTATARITFTGVEIDGIAEGTATIGDHPTEPAASAATPEQLAALAHQLQTLLAVQPQCAACAAEARQGQRPGVNLVNVIVGGEGLCHEHVDVVGGRLVRRNSSGLIVAGG